MAVAAGVVGDAEAPLLDALAVALEANRQLSELAGGLIEENARLRARDAERDAEFEKLQADFAVLQRMLFGRNGFIAIGEARKKQMQAPGPQEPANKALATLDREWGGLTAHRGYPMVSLDNNAAERIIRGSVVTRKNARAPVTGAPPGTPPSSGPSPPPPRWPASTS